jgi:hypothetical protein
MGVFFPQVYSAQVTQTCNHRPLKHSWLGWLLSCVGFEGWFGVQGWISASLYRFPRAPYWVFNLVQAETMEFKEAFD